MAAFNNNMLSDFSFEDMGGGMFDSGSLNLQDLMNYAAPMEQPVATVMPTPEAVYQPPVAPAPVTPAVASTAKPNTSQSAIDALTQQILGQGTTDKWRGGVDAQTAAKDMAKIMAGIGITDINQFGKFTQTGIPEQVRPDGRGGFVDMKGKPVDPSIVQVSEYSGEAGNWTDYTAPVGTQEVYGNKATGQVVPETYGERQTGNAFGGTFEGKGNTGYRVDFDASGKPVFYTTGASSSDAANAMPFIQMALLATGAGGLLGNALLGSGASQVAANALGGAILGGGTSALTGGDVLKGALMGGAGGALSGYLAPEVPQISGSEQLARELGQDVAGGLLSNGNEAISSVAANLPITSSITEAPVLDVPTIQAPPIDMSLPAIAEASIPTVTQPTVPTDVQVPEMVVTAPSTAPVQTPVDLGIDYSLANGTTMRPLTDMGGAQGVQPGTSANLPDMGGGQGLTINVGPPSTTLADALANFGGVNPAYMPDMGGAQGLTYKTPSGLVTESAIIPAAGLLSTLGETGINTATNIGSNIGAELAKIDTGINAPTTEVPPASTNPLSNLTPSQIANILKGALGLFGAAGASQLGSGGGSSINVGALPTQGIPLNSRDYFNAIQQNYNTLMPTLPRDVATPLANWYNSQYGA